MSIPDKERTDKITLARELWRIAESNEIEELHELLAHGVDVNLRQDAGVTALMIAAYHGRIEMVRALTDRGADVNLADKDGFTAAMLAHQRGYAEIVSTLVARGARKPTTLASTQSPVGPQRNQLAGPIAAPPTHSYLPRKSLPTPPNIWDVVQESHLKFDPKSDLVGHLPGVDTLLLAVIATIVVGAAVFAFIKLNASPRNLPANLATSDHNGGSSVSAPNPTQADATAAQARDSATIDSSNTQSTEAVPLTISPDDSGLAAIKSSQTVRRPSRREAPRLDSQSIETSGPGLFATESQPNANRARKPITMDAASSQPPGIKSANSTNVNAREINKPQNPSSLVVPTRPSPTPKRN